MYFDVAKHIYDISVMMGLPQIQCMIEEPSIFFQMLEYKRREETKRTGSDLSDKKFYEFKIFCGFENNEALQTAYMTMQKNYVFKRQDVLPFSYVVEHWLILGEQLKKLERIYPVIL